MRLMPMLLLLACGDDGRDSSTTDTAGTTSSTTLTPISHAEVVQPIWEGTCGATCHLGMSSFGGLSLEGDGRDDLVKVESGQLPSMKLVKPGNLEKSYLWHKLQNTHVDVGGNGVAMPKVGSLTDDELDIIELWILSGANP